MRFSYNVIGPTFDQADLAVFEFDDAEISLRLPRIPDDTLGFVAAQNQKKLGASLDKHWEPHPLGFRCLDLVRQAWEYYDGPSENSVVRQNFKLILVDIPTEMQEEISPLNSEIFLRWLFYFYRLMAIEGDMSLLDTDDGWRMMKEQKMALSVEDIELYDSGLIDWPMLPMGYGTEAYADVDPDYRIYIPINERLFLYVDSSTQILSTDHDAINVPKKDIDKLKRDILMEILSHICVRYSPKVMARIEAKN